MLMISLALCLNIVAKMPVELPADITVMVTTNKLTFPIEYSREERGRIKKLHIFVSVSQGKDWQRVSSEFPTAETFRHQVERDGFYWFAMQIELNNGKFDPPQPTNFEYIQKSSSTRQSASSSNLNPWNKSA